MHPVIETSGNFMVGSVFGSAYVSEHHFDDAHRYLPPSNREHVCGEILKALRSALSIRPAAP